MPPELTDLTDQITLTPLQALGIPIALIGAVFLSLGAQFQHAGVGIVEANDGGVSKAGLSLKQLLALLRRPSWVIGTGMLGLAVVFQLVSIGLAPLTVVQPLGALALVITAVVTARRSGIPLDAISIRAIVFCVGGVALFVAVATVTTKTHPITTTELTAVLIILGVVLTAFAVTFGLFRKRLAPIFYIIGAGVLFGFVATLAKVVIGRVQTLIADEFQRTDLEWLTILCVIALLAASVLGSYFVQTAYSNGPPDLVVAGLTVIDPIVAIVIAIVVLGEASTAPLWAIGAFVVAGVIAVYGVVQLAKHHPQLQGTLISD